MLVRQHEQDYDITLIDQKRNSYKFEYFGGTIYPRLKNHVFEKYGFTLKLPNVSSMRQIFLSRGGHYMVMQILHKNVHVANIGFRFLNPEGRRVTIKTVFVQPVGTLKSLISDVNKSRKKRKLKTMHRVDANTGRKVFIRPQSTPKIVQSFIKETRTWMEKCSEFLNEK